MSGTAATVVAAVASAGVAAASAAVLAVLGTLMVFFAAEWAAKKVLGVFTGDKDPASFPLYSEAEFGARNRAAARGGELSDGPPEQGIRDDLPMLYDDDEYERNRP